MGGGGEERTEEVYFTWNTVKNTRETSHGEIQQVVGDVGVKFRGELGFEEVNFGVTSITFNTVTLHREKR